MQKVMFEQECESVIKKAFMERVYRLQSNNTIDLVTFMFDNRHTGLYAVEIELAIGKKKQTINHRIFELSQRGFIFKNHSGYGKPGCWQLIGVEEVEKKKRPVLCPKPQLNPIIQSVFC